jgi:hypothetical protein
MDRRTQPESDFGIGSFIVSYRAEVRFIRLTQMSNHVASTAPVPQCGNGGLVLGAVEFFGTLSE